MERDPHPRPAFWSVWRTDDAGNTFPVRKHLSEAEANAVAAEFTARGHKQYYFAEREGTDPPANPPL